jgi:MoxR-like ATPase
MSVPESPDLLPQLRAASEHLLRVRSEMGRVIVGQKELIHRLLVGLVARGHILLEGLPGLAKTASVSTLARATHCRFSRIQFTPDLLPGDITGTLIYDPVQGTYSTRQGPIFANLVLADEINRAPSKVQSALLEAMQERQVTIGDRTWPLPEPFLVLATQNPIEQEGTYPLPEAQLDRFMFLIEVEYPSAEEEKRIARETTGAAKQALSKLIDGEKIIAFQQLVRRVPVPDHLYDYAVKIVRKTRPGQPESPQWIKDTVGWGAGPRAVQYLILGAKARAALRGNYMASLEDLEAVAPAVLNHRVITNFAAESQGMTSKKIIQKLIGEMADA